MDTSIVSTAFAQNFQDEWITRKALARAIERDSKAIRRILASIKTKPKDSLPASLKPFAGQVFSSSEPLPKALGDAIILYFKTKHEAVDISVLSLFDNNKFRLGALCKRGHDFEGTGKTLRYLENRACVQCRTVLDKERYILKHDEILLQKQEYRNRPEVAERQSLWGKNRRLKFPEFVREYDRTRYRRDWQKRREAAKAYNALNKEKISERNKAWRNGPGKHLVKAGNSRRRAKLKQTVSYPYSKHELALRFSMFNNKCAYCGEMNDLQLDHFLPVAFGGTDNIGNFIPACKRCNLNKKANDPYEWYKKQEFYCSKKWKTILKILGKTQANYNQLVLI